MSYLKISIFSSLVILLAVVQAQNYLLEGYDPEDEVRVKRDMVDFILHRNNPEASHLRHRRDDDTSRHRRQGSHGGGHEGITGPVHTFVKTDEHAHFKWGVRHHVGHEYAGRR